MDTYPDKNLPELNNAIDLKLIFDEINRNYFDNKLECRVIFGRKYHSPRTRCIRLGSFNCATNTIRINPDLNDLDIPLFLIKYIMYHEMTHAWCYQNHSRLRHRGPFQLKEKEFTDFKIARKWLRDNKKLFFKR